MEIDRTTPTKRCCDKCRIDRERYAEVKLYNINIVDDYYLMCESCLKELHRNIGKVVKSCEDNILKLPCKLGSIVWTVTLRQNDFSGYKYPCVVQKEFGLEDYFKIGITDRKSVV